MNRLFKILTVALLAIITAFTCFGCTDSSKGDSETGLKYKKVDNGYIVSKFVDDGRDTIDLGTELAEIKNELGNGTRLIIAKNSAPRNREENTLYNLIEILSDIQQNYKKYNYRSNDQLNLVNYIYQSQNIKYDVRFCFRGNDCR